MKWLVNCSVWFLLVRCLTSAVVGSQVKDVECPSGCDAEKCQCSEDETGIGLFVVCEGLTESFAGCLDINVVEFQLHNSNITLLAASDFRNATKLETLEITDNFKLVEIEEHAFRELKSLRRIYLDNNALSKLEKSIFPADGVLEEIRLDKNKIEMIQYESVFAGLENSLRHLRLEFNVFTEFTCPRLHKLSTLDLSENRMRPLSREMFRECPHLVEINLSGNFIRNLSVNWEPLKALQTLDLNDNEISEVGKDFQESLPSLRYLFLSFNKLRSIPPLPINLLRLRLSGNPFETIHNYTFENLTQLTSLDISDAPDLTSIQESAFVGLRSLSSLSLSFNRKLSSLPPNPWPDSRDLGLMILVGNNISIFHKSLFEDLHGLWLVEIHWNPIHCSCANSWIRLEMDNPDNSWIFVWKTGSRAVSCLTPDNLEGFLISQLNAYDLTCNVSRMLEHSLTTTTDGAVLQAVLVEGVPSTSWYFPDGRHIYAHRQNEDQFEDDPKMDEILWDNLTIFTRLTLNNSGQSLTDFVHGQYVLEWTNAAGSDNFTFTVGGSTSAPPPHGGGTNPAAIAVTILSIGMVIIFIVGGVFLRRYLRSRRLNSIEPSDEDTENMSSSDIHVQNEPEGGSMVSPTVGYGSRPTYESISSSSQGRIAKGNEY